MKQLFPIKYTIAIALLTAFFLSSCQSSWPEQRYKNLKKVAVNAKAEADTICNHISDELIKTQYETLFVQQSMSDTTLITDVAVDKVVYKKPFFSTISKVAKDESMRLATKYAHASDYNRSDGKMDARDTNIWWLWGVLIFIAAFMIAVALIRWISESGSGCLVIGSWILFSVLLVWLLFWMIL